MAIAQAKRMALPGGVIVHDPRIEPFEPAFFDPRYWRDNGEIRPAQAGRGGSWFVTSAHGSWVLRHYRRGGFVAALSTDRYFFTGYDATRALREWSLLRQLRDWGLPVPRPIAARVARGGLTYRADLITETIPDTRTLSARVLDGSCTHTVMAAVGATVRRFHERGVSHADLNAHNILVDTAGAVYLIDFDRGRLRAAGAWREAAMHRLRRSLDKITGSTFDEALWTALTTAYRTSPARP